MATTGAIAIRRANATSRLQASLDVLGERFNLSVPPEVLRPPMRDIELGRAIQLDAFAIVLEQVVMATAPGEVEATATPLVIDGVKPEHLDALAAAGITDLDGLRSASDDELLAVKGIGPATVERIRNHLADVEPAEE